MIITIIITDVITKTLILRQNFKLHKLECGPSTSVRITKFEGMELYRRMKAIREMELATIEISNEMSGPSHLCNGQVS